jgi:hypothetical protein
VLLVGVNMLAGSHACFGAGLFYLGNGTCTGAYAVLPIWGNMLAGSHAFYRAGLFFTGRGEVLYGRAEYDYRVSGESNNAGSRIEVSI